MKPLSVVTGGLGFMGSYMVEVLARQGHRVRVLDLPFEGDAEAEIRAGKFLSVARRCQAEVVFADITDRKALTGKVEDADYCFHIAALFNYTSPLKDLLHVNVEGTKNLCRLLMKSRKLKRLVVWGSGAVYGIPKKEDLPVTEDAPIQPLSDYGESKRQEEEVVERYYIRGLPATWIRPTAVYGARDVHTYLDFFRMVKKSPAVLLPRNFTFSLPFVHGIDVARAALHLALRPDTAGEVYHVDDNSGLTYDAAVRLLAKHWDKYVIEIVPLPLPWLKEGLYRVASLENRVAKLLKRKPLLPKDLILFLGGEMRYSNQKLRNTGFRFQYPTLEKGLLPTLKWYEEAGLL